MSVTPEIEAEIMRAHDANPTRFSPFRVAKAVGATINEVTDTVSRNKNLRRASEGVGQIQRPRLEKFIVASRRVTDPCWQNRDPAIAAARAAFEAGTHTMATHRSGSWQHLCLFPLTRVRPRPNYFKGGKF